MLFFSDTLFLRRPFRPGRRTACRHRPAGRPARERCLHAETGFLPLRRGARAARRRARLVLHAILYHASRRMKRIFAGNPPCPADIPPSCLRHQRGHCRLPCRRSPGVQQTKNSLAAAKNHCCPNLRAPFLPAPYDQKLCCLPARSNTFFYPPCPADIPPSCLRHQRGHRRLPCGRSPGTTDFPAFRPADIPPYNKC